MGAKQRGRMRGFKARWFLLVFFVLLFMSLSSAMSPAVLRHRLEALRRQLLSNYSGHFAPFEEVNKPFPVLVIFSIFAVIDLNAAQEVLTTQNYIGLTWVDPDLGWNITEDGSPGKGVHLIELNADDIWTPKIVIANRAGDGLVLRQYASAVVMHDGNCRAEMPLQLSTLCQVDVTYYPFDTQQCQVMLTPMYGDNLSLTGYVLSLKGHGVYQASGEWEVEEVVAIEQNITDSSLKFRQQYVEIRLMLRRHYLFHVVTVLFPMMILSITGATGFLLPLQCGERVSFQVAIMVSLSVFLGFINDSMPKTSTSTSRLAVYLDLLLLQSCLSCLATLITLRRQYHREKLEQEQKEKTPGSSSIIAPESQSVTRESTDATPQEDGGLLAVASHAGCCCRWLRHAIRYCSCCLCVAPQNLDVFFFVVFMTTAVCGPVVFFL